ncbi:MAG: UDP-N-acetylmuramoyl-tripeptide--D-alanyl-D-alanine ligase [Candidatus Desantisbacteria bacterium]
MLPISVNEILIATEGELVCGDREWLLEAGVSTDSRGILSEQLFIALKGENFDGHKFIGQVIDRGAGGVIFSDEVGIGQIPCAIKVKDTLAALGHLAAYYRSKFNIPIIGITGSNGKTTTKEMLGDVLSKQWTVLRNKKNFNNAIGLPLTLLELDNSAQFCVAEMGMNHPGEIAYLANIANPGIGVITNVSESHIGHFEDKKAIAMAKFELIEAMGGGGIAILNADDPFVVRMAGQYKGRVVFFGLNSNADVFATGIKEDDSGIRFRVSLNDGKYEEIFMPIHGRHNVYNALAVCGVLVALGLDLSLAASGLEGFKLPDSRMEIIESHGLRIINDAYNANPGSMKAALSTLSGIACSGRRIVVMGDMLELGKWSEELHRDVGMYISDAGIDVLVTVGQNSAFAASEAKDRGVKTFACQDHAEAIHILKAMIKSGDVVLIKGSRGMRMEEAVQALQET